MNFAKKKLFKQLALCQLAKAKQQADHASNEEHNTTTCSKLVAELFQEVFCCLRGAFRNTFVLIMKKIVSLLLLLSLSFRKTLFFR